MNRLMQGGLAALALGCASAIAPTAKAQVSVDIGVAPDCPYGYYDYAPYDCAPYGYYGPEWFDGGVFIGAGPWFHGPAHFRGHVDSRFDQRRGFNGPLPRRGEARDPGRRIGMAPGFRGDEMHDAQGRAGGGRR